MQSLPIFGVVEVVVPHVAEPVVEPTVSRPIIPAPAPVCVSCITAASSNHTNSTATSSNNTEIDALIVSTITDALIVFTIGLVIAIFVIVVVRD